MSLAGRVAIVIGGGQTSGATIGNGRACAVQYARDGAHVVVADISDASACETVAQIDAESLSAQAMAVDVASDQQLQAMIEAVAAEHGRIDVLNNNVGVSLAGGDAPADRVAPAFIDIYEADWVAQPDDG